MNWLRALRQRSEEPRWLGPSEGESLSRTLLPSVFVGILGSLSSCDHLSEPTFLPHLPKDIKVYRVRVLMNSS